MVSIWMKSSDICSPQLVLQLHQLVDMMSLKFGSIESESY